MIPWSGLMFAVGRAVLKNLAATAALANFADARSFHIPETFFLIKLGTISFGPQENYHC